MLDSEIIQQLKTHFATLASELTFSLYPSRDPHQGELRSLLADVVSCSSRLKVIEQGDEVKGVRFDVLKNGTPTGIQFRAIPGGHEFTSLILAILNTDGKGKLPDPDLQRRVKALKGPIDLTTYISLACTNCPDVVQALNLMAILHGDMRHQVVDGALFSSEIEELGIQAVPSVFSGGKLIHVGKSNFADLLDMLEDLFGVDTGANAENLEPPSSVPRNYDVVIIGGGPAGCSAAIYSARKGLKTALVAQKLGGQVLETVGIENLISVPYTEGARLAADLEKHLRKYPVDIFENRKVDEVRVNGKREVHFKGGTRLIAEALIIATGAKWRELGIVGEKEYLGRGVAFCPHCDGPFYKEKPIAVIGGGNSGIEAALDLAGICSHVTVLEYLDRLRADEVLIRKLEELKNTRVITSARATEIVGNGKNVTAIRYQDRITEQLHEVQLDGVFVQIGLVPQSALLKDLVKVNQGGEIVIDSSCRTSVPGIYAAGDVTTVPFKQIIVAMGEGAKAALTAFEDRIRAVSQSGT
jgi:NADH-dependent peroxiredoxin subunit F